MGNWSPRRHCISYIQGSLFVLLPSPGRQLKIRVFHYHQLKICFFQPHQLNNQYSPRRQQFISQKCTLLRNYNCCILNANNKILVLKNVGISYQSCGKNCSVMWKMKGCPQSSGSNCNIHNPLSNVIAVAKNGEVKKECMYKKAFWVILSRLASFISKPGHNESLTESFSAPRNRKLVIT